MRQVCEVLCADSRLAAGRSWCGISGFAGFYVANTVSLSFGALAVNDIVAAALAVTFVELSTRAFYTAWPNPCVPWWSAGRTQR